MLQKHCLYGVSCLPLQRSPELHVMIQILSDKTLSPVSVFPRILAYVHTRFQRPALARVDALLQALEDWRLYTQPDQVALSQRYTARFYPSSESVWQYLRSVVLGLSTGWEGLERVETGWVGNTSSIARVGFGMEAYAGKAGWETGYPYIFW
jgi:hypothetical protein